MDFLDPQKQRQHAIRLMIGYILIGLAVLIATAILLYRAYGFGLGKDGEVVQNGLVFVASQPDNAEIYLNNKLHDDRTGARIQIQEGQYSLDVKKAGYHGWHRDITVAGGSVSRFDYPLLIPTTLTPTPVKSHPSQPVFAAQSPDRRWLVVAQPGSAISFDRYNLSDPEQVTTAVTSFNLPSAVVSNAAAPEHSWKLTEWSTDNRRVIVEHTSAGATEYILIDHEEPEQSLNLTRTLGLTPGQALSLRDKKFDQYYIFDAAAKSLTSGSIEEGLTRQPVLSGVLAFKSYGTNILLYATDADATPGKVKTLLRDGEVTYDIRELNAGGPYLLDLARYDREWYIAVGASAENKTYVFQNPQSVRKAGRVVNLVPAKILRVTAPNHLAFSSNTRFIMIENGTSFAVYDAETDKSYTYATAAPLDSGVAHATWMDGHRITYVSGGRQVIFDYDNINFQTLVQTSPAFLPFFDRDYRYLYTVVPPAQNGQSTLTSTPLLIEADR